jgi:predicted amidohydrolase
MVYVAGWPGILREDGSGYSNIFYVSINGEVSDITDRRFIVEFNRDEWIVTLGVREPEELEHYGGFSGGPVFLFIDGELKLVGFICEDGANFFDGMQIVQSSFINRDGTIHHV